jgi:hypothetical protein
MRVRNFHGCVFRGHVISRLCSAVHRLKGRNTRCLLFSAKMDIWIWHINHKALLRCLICVSYAIWLVSKRIYIDIVNQT